MSEIGEALGVSKQAVQKRFTGERQWLKGAELLTPRARKTMSDHAEKAARELVQPSIGTEALLLGIWGEPKGVAALALKRAGVDRKKTRAAIDAILPPGTGFVGGYTPRAWAVMEHCITIAATMGHNFIGTEHLLISLLSGEADSVAVRALDALGVELAATTAFVKQTLNG